MDGARREKRVFSLRIGKNAVIASARPVELVENVT